MPTASNPRAAPTRPLERLAWFMAALAVAIFLTCLHLTTTPQFKLTTFDRLVNFTAVEPFQHRVLLPAIVAGLQLYLPLGEKLLFGILEIVGWVTLIALAYRALVQFQIGRNDLLRRVLAFTIVIPMFMQLIAPDLHLVSSFVVNEHRLEIGNWQPRALYYYVYDLPAAVFVFAMTMVLARHARTPSRQSLLLYLLLFVIATVNRETTIFMLGCCVLLFLRRMPWPRLLALLVAQLLLFAAIQWPLHWLFADNVNPSARLTGIPYEDHLLENLGLLTDPLYLVTFLGRFAAGLYLPVLLWHRLLDRRLGAALVGFGLPLVAMALLAGRLQEQRIFVEIVPLIWICAMQVIATRSAQTPGESSRRPDTSNGA